MAALTSLCELDTNKEMINRGDKNEIMKFMMGYCSRYVQPYQSLSNSSPVWLRLTCVGEVFVTWTAPKSRNDGWNIMVMKVNNGVVEIM